MADWRDGPEYAPSARPGGFTPPPDAVPLAPAPRPGHAAEAPAERPDFGPVPEVVALGDLQAPEPLQRDPREAFDVASTPLTAAPAGRPVPDAPTEPLQLPSRSAWDAVHAPQAAPRSHAGWAPQRPLALPDQLPPGSFPAGHAYPPPHVNPQSFPPPDADQWYAPYAPQHPPPGPRPVTLPQLWQAVTPGVLISLIVGAVVPLLAVPMMFIAHGLVGRILYRRGAVQNLFRIVEGGTALFAVLTMFTDFGAFDLGLFWEHWQGWAQFGNWVLAVTVSLTVGAALRAGEPPESQYP